MPSKRPLVQVHKGLLKLLSNLPKKKRNKVIALLKKEEVNSISEIFKNFLNKNLTVDKKIIKKVNPYKKEIRRLALKSVPLKEKVKILISPRGGSLLGFLLPVAVNLISKLFG